MKRRKEKKKKKKKKEKKRKGMELWICVWKFMDSCLALLFGSRVLIGILPNP